MTEYKALRLIFTLLTYVGISFQLASGLLSTVQDRIGSLIPESMPIIGCIPGLGVRLSWGKYSNAKLKLS